MDFNDAILWVLGLVTFLSVLEWTGIMPSFISKWLHRNRLAESISILKELGVDVERHKKINISMSVDRGMQGGDLKKSLRKDLKKFVHSGRFTVGRTSSVVENGFLDVMGATVDYKTAELFSKYLTTFWGCELESNGDVVTPDVDFIVTPKRGSPILGYEFSKRMKIPFVLHGSTEEKFVTDNAEESFFGSFDCVSKPEKGSVCLIVDDSATGGRKVTEAYDDLIRYGYKVTDCLVLFEPEVKSVRARLNSKGIKLHSIIKR